MALALKLRTLLRLSPVLEKRQTHQIGMQFADL